MNKLFRKQNLLYSLLSAVLIIFTQCSGSVDNQLKKIAKEATEKCPIMLDKWTRLDSCAALPGRTYKYYHTIQELEVTDTTLFKTQFEPQILSLVKMSPDMKFFRENEVSLLYQYNDQNKKYLFTISINPDQYKK